MGTVAFASAAAILAAALAGATAATAAAAELDPHYAGSTTTGTRGEIKTSATWHLDPGLHPGDTWRVLAPEHVAGIDAPIEIRDDGGSLVATGTVDGDYLVFVLTEAVADWDSADGELILTTATDTSTLVVPGATFDGNPSATVLPGERPGGVFEPADREAAAKWGRWVDDLETTLQWTIESPRGPWSEMTVMDSPLGQAIDCFTLTVRSTKTVEDGTGHLLNLKEVGLARAAIDCTTDGLTVQVTEVEDDEIIEIAFETATKGETVAMNTANITGTRPDVTTSARATRTVVSGVAVGVPRKVPPTSPPEVSTTPPSKVPAPPPSSFMPPSPSVAPPSSLAATGTSAAALLGVCLAGVLGGGLVLVLRRAHE